MHGCGNDFVMIDGISQRISLTAERVQKISDRNFGIGCDQLLLVEPPRSPHCDFRYRIFNQDGTEVENCGNGARCFAVFVRKVGLTTKNIIRVETATGEMVLKVHGDNQVTVDMGVPILAPHLVPFHAEETANTYTIDVEGETFDISAVPMGNPHSVALVDDVDNYPVTEIGPKIEAHSRFPNKVNAGFLQVLSPTEAKLRVYERGVGETLACGTGACAAMVAGRLRGLFDSSVQIHLPGGTLSITWEGEGKPVMMTGPATSVFHGQIRP